VLRVCADPNNLPFSNQRLEGFENKLAEMIAKENGEKLEYTWWAQRRGFFRNTLKANACDVVMGVPAGFEMALTTSPYYRSSYVFITRKDKNLDIKSFDDPVLRKLKIGVQMVGDDLATRLLPTRSRDETSFRMFAAIPSTATTRNLTRRRESSMRSLAGKWTRRSLGTFGGLLRKQSKVPLRVVAVSPQVDQPFLPFVYDISMGVRRGDQQLKDQLEQFWIRDVRTSIDCLLSTECRAWTKRRLL